MAGQCSAVRTVVNTDGTAYVYCAQVERRAEKSVADLLQELVVGNKEVQDSNGKLVAVLTQIQKTLGADAAGSEVKPGIVQLVTECDVPDGVCLSTQEANINAVIKGVVYVDVAGIYTCHFTTPKNKVLTSKATARPAGPDGFAIITCKSPVHTPEYIPAKAWVSTVGISQSGETLKFGGKDGKNKVKFASQGPTITGGPTARVKASVGKDKGVFTFRVKIDDADTAFTDIKLALTTSHTDFMPVSGIKAGVPDQDGYVTFTGTPVLAKIGKLAGKTFIIKITLTATDTYGLKSATVPVEVSMSSDSLIIKLCTSDGNIRRYHDTAFWVIEHLCYYMYFCKYDNNATPLFWGGRRGSASVCD